MELPRNTVPIDPLFHGWAYDLWMAANGSSNHLSDVSKRLDSIMQEIQNMIDKNKDTV